MYSDTITKKFPKIYKKDHKPTNTLRNPVSTASKPSETSNRKHKVWRLC